MLMALMSKSLIPRLRINTLRSFRSSLIIRMDDITCKDEHARNAALVRCLGLRGHCIIITAVPTTKHFSVCSPVVFLAFSARKIHNYRLFGIDSRNNCLLGYSARLGIEYYGRRQRNRSGLHGTRNRNASETLVQRGRRKNCCVVGFKGIFGLPKLNK